MANQVQLNILNQGVTAWNQWRHNNLMTPVDLSGADLSKRDLSGVRLDSANLTRVNLRETNLQGAVLTSTNFHQADFTSANLNSARLLQANLSNSRFVNVDARNAELIGVNLENADTHNTKYNRWSRYQGVRLSGCYGSQKFIRYAIDQSYIEEFRGHLAPGSEPLFNDPQKFSSTLFQIKRYIRFFPSIRRNPKFWFLYLPWLILSDCGRSFSLWFFWSIFIAIFFGAVYAGYPAPEWLPESVRNLLVDVAPAIDLSREKTPFTPYYFSIVTFTTLGFGDVLPKNLAGEIWLTIEVIIGYIMLGGLISIFSSKIARRGA